MFVSLRILSKFSTSFYKQPLKLASTQDTFKYSDISIQKTDTPAQLPPTTTKDLVFGSVPTDHMLTIDWTEEGGWGKPKITPFKPFSIHPFASSLHYGLQCYEGLKAYKDQKGKIRLFRPQCNMHRFKISSSSLCLPDFDGKQLLDCIKALVKLDERWIPSKRGFGLYIRPFHIAMEQTLGVKEAKTTRIATVLNPVGPYYQSGFEPIRLLTEVEKIRSAPGGYGSFKVGGNYGPTIKPAKQAKKEGFSQCLFLFDGQVVEVGSSNIFFLLKGKDGVKELHTPLLDDGLILPGITRDSVIELTKLKKGHRVIERKIMIDEIIQAFDQNRVLEIFATGTAVVISPVKELSYKGKSYHVPIDPVKKAGELSYELFNEMLDIQNGNKKHQWCVELN